MRVVQFPDWYVTRLALKARQESPFSVSNGAASVPEERDLQPSVQQEGRRGKPPQLLPKDKTTSSRVAAGGRPHALQGKQDGPQTVGGTKLPPGQDRLPERLAKKGEKNRKTDISTLNIIP